MAYLGRTAAGDTNYPASGNRCNIAKFTAAEDGTLTGNGRLGIRSVDGGTNVKLVMYADSGGEPGVLLTVSAGVSANAAVVTPTGLSGSIVSGTSYWIGVVFDSFTAGADLQSSGGQARSRDDVTYANPTDPWNQTGDSSASSEIVAAVEYTAGGGGGGGASVVFPRWSSVRR